MAKGNVGNILQHFVVVTAAERLVRTAATATISYVDCFSMAPWESMPTKKRPFGELLGAIEAADPKTDATVRAFHQALAFGAPHGGLYPNSAVLLRAGFRETDWRMRLHDVEEKKRVELLSWGRSSATAVQVEGDFRSSPLIKRAPIAVDEAVLVALDPFQVVSRASTDRTDGDLHVSELRWMLGEHCLSLSHRLTSRAAPVVVALFSYAEAAPDATDRVVRSILDPRWSISRIKIRALGGRPRTFHQAWWIASTEDAACADLPRAWREWTISLGVPLDAA